jgi:hypothetical protein
VVCYVDVKFFFANAERRNILSGPHGSTQELWR